MHHRSFTLCFSLALACSGAPEVDAPPPLVVDDPPDSLALIEPSVIESEVRYDLEPALTAIESGVPRRFGDIEKRLPMEGNKRAHFSFAATRAPFRIAFDGKQATVSTTIEYEGRGWYKPPVGPEISAACGTGGVPRPRARVRLVSKLALTPGWTLQSRSRIATVEPVSEEARDRCRVTVFRVDVTEKVMRATSAELQKQLLSLDRSLATVKARARFERWWRDVSRPIRLTDSVWFTINPVDVKLRGMTNDSGSLVAGLRVTARPRIHTGNRPNDFDLFTPLPPLGRADSTQGALRVTLDGHIDYGVASGMLRGALAGKTINIGPRRVVVSDVEIRGIGGGRIALGVRFGGGVFGQVFLTGTPSYSQELDQLLVPDLAYDLRTQDLLVQGIAWLKDDAILSFLREKARFPVNSQLDRLRVLAEQGMNRDIATGVRLVARLDRARAISVQARVGVLRVRALATGEAHLEVDKPLTVRPPVGKKR